MSLTWFSSATRIMERQSSSVTAMRLLAEDVDPAARRPFGVLPVQMIGQGDVDRVDRPAVQALVELLVGVPPLDLILAAQLLQLLRIVGDEGGQLGVFGVGKSRQHGDLGDMSQTDDGVTDLLCAAARACGALGPLRLLAMGRRGRS